MDPFAPQERKPYRQYLVDRWRVFFIAYIGYVIFYLVRNNFKLTAGVVGVELDIVTVGEILAFFTIAYGAGKVFAGILIDRTSMKRVFAISMAISGIVCAAIPLASSVLSLKILLGLLGLAQAPGSPASLSMIGAWFPNATRGTVVTLWNTSQNVGAGLLAAYSMTLLASTEYWQLIFWVPAAIAVFFSVVVWRSSSDRPWQEGYPTLTQMYGAAGVPQPNVTPHDSYWKLLASAILTSPVLIGLMILNALLYYVRFGVVNWMPHYVGGEKDLGLDASHQAFSALELGAVPMVVLFAFLAHRRPASMASVGAISMALLSILVVGYMLANHTTTVSWVAFILGGLIYAPQVIVNVLTLNLLPPRIVGAAVGAVGLSGYLVGEVGANLVIPRIASSSGWDGANLTIVGACLFAAIIYTWLRPYEKKALVLTS